MLHITLVLQGIIAVSSYACLVISWPDFILTLPLAIQISAHISSGSWLLLALSSSISFIVLVTCFSYDMSRLRLVSVLTMWLFTTLFFASNDMVTSLIFLELQVVPLIFLTLPQTRTFIGPITHSQAAHYEAKLKSSQQAVMFLVLFSLISGLCLSTAFSILYQQYGTLSISFLTLQSTAPVYSKSMVLLYISGACKLALVPMHIWLPKVHAESSTAGSVILAALSLKAGFKLHVGFSTLWAYLLSVSHIIFTAQVILLVIISLSLFYQADTKRWVALYSITHMGVLYFLSRYHFPHTSCHIEGL